MNDKTEKALSLILAATIGICLAMALVVWWS
jgi:hypothetical protein